MENGHCKESTGRSLTPRPSRIRRVPMHGLAPSSGRCATTQHKVVRSEQPMSVPPVRSYREHGAINQPFTSWRYQKTTKLRLQVHPVSGPFPNTASRTSEATLHLRKDEASENYLSLSFSFSFFSFFLSFFLSFSSFAFLSSLSFSLSLPLSFFSFLTFSSSDPSSCSFSLAFSFCGGVVGGNGGPRMRNWTMAWAAMSSLQSDAIVSALSEYPLTANIREPGTT
mmetsp:Transcript_54470/g.138145  ORF Transcript_54470/g.138145 Transcript_54470/m.138145 type:complete len:225 (+) Transcript_54470:155-829(+)